MLFKGWGCSEPGVAGWGCSEQVYSRHCLGGGVVGERVVKGGTVVL